MFKFYFCLLIILFVPSALAEAFVGSPAPDFELQASDGNTYTLSEFKGKKGVVIAFCPKVFTVG